MSLRTLAIVSGVYDLLLALGLLAAAADVARLFGAPPPVPPVNAQLNGVFTLAVGAGYFWALREPRTLRGYLWLFNVLAKGLGALLFLADQFTQGSPRTFLLFVATDGGLALLALWLLRRKEQPEPAS